MSTGSHGYGQIGWNEDGTKIVTLTHRVAWELEHGPIPDDMTIDHLCRNRRCCNPSHLRLLTNPANGRNNGQATKTHCPAGHRYGGNNLYVSPEGYRRCRACARRGRWKRKRNE